MLYGSIRRNLYAHLSIHKMRWTLVFDYLFTPISTPKWHESIWFCMKFYEFTISKNFVTMRFYGLLLMYIDLWKKANLQRYLISYIFILLQFSFIFNGFQRSASRLLHHFCTIFAFGFIGLSAGTFCTALIFVGDHPVKKTVFHAQFPEACFAMGFPCGNLVPAAARIKEAL